ncbi:MAG TPA: hypothetical protein DCM45_04660, partial [Clostridiales bacterium]|nr:hypothetical protein [Clostridiales bacterium]
MSQISFALGDINRSKVKYFRFFIQLLISFYIICLISSIIFQLMTFKHKIETFGHAADIYIIKDRTNEEQITKNLFENVDAQAKLFQLYSKVQHLADCKAYSFYSQALPLDDRRLKNLAAFQAEYGGFYYKRLFVDQAFIEAFRLKCKTGGFLNNNQQQQGCIPVVLGSSFQSYFNIGDRIDERRIVVGFLEDKAFYLSPGETEAVLYLDKTILEPLVITSESDITELDRAINKTTILTQNPASLTEIKNLSVNLGLYDLEFVSFSRQLELIISETLAYVLSLLVLVFLILLFCITCLVTSLLSFIDDHRHEFAVHLLCGARTASFIRRIGLQVGLIIALSDVIVLFANLNRLPAVALTAALSIA